MHVPLKRCLTEPSVPTFSRQIPVQACHARHRQSSASETGCAPLVSQAAKTTPSLQITRKMTAKVRAFLCVTKQAPARCPVRTRTLSPAALLRWEGADNSHGSHSSQLSKYQQISHQLTKQLWHWYKIAFVVSSKALYLGIRQP